MDSEKNTGDYYYGIGATSAQVSARDLNGISKMAAIPRAYSNLSANLEDVSKSVEALEGLLSNILRADSPELSSGECAQAYDVTCGLAQSIQDDAERLARIAGRLHGILNRIEL